MGTLKWKVCRKEEMIAWSLEMREYRENHSQQNTILSGKYLKHVCVVVLEQWGIHNEVKLHLNCKKPRAEEI